MFAHMRFVYGKTTIRFSGEGCEISSAVYATRDHACGLSAATAANRAQSAPTNA